MGEVAPEVPGTLGHQTLPEINRAGASARDVVVGFREVEGRVEGQNPTDTVYLNGLPFTRSEKRWSTHSGMPG